MAKILNADHPLVTEGVVYALIGVNADNEIVDFVTPARGFTPQAGVAIGEGALGKQFTVGFVSSSNRSHVLLDAATGFSNAAYPNKTYYVVSAGVRAEYGLGHLWGGGYAEPVISWDATSGKLQAQRASLGAVLLESTSAVGDTPFTVSLTRNTTTNTSRLYVNGVEEASGAPVGSDGGASFNAIGGYTTFGGVEQDIVYILLVTRELTPAEHAALDASLGPGNAFALLVEGVQPIKFNVPIEDLAYPLSEDAGTLNLAAKWSGTKTPFSFAVTGGSLPPGVTLSSAGKLAVYPTVAGVYADIVITGTDKDGTTAASNAFTIEVIARGVKGPDIPSTGQHGPSVLYQYVTLPADNNVRFYAELVAPPAVGEFGLFLDGSFTWFAPDQTNDSFTYRWYRDGVDQGTSTVNLTMGAPANQAPTANAGTDQTVNEGDAVVLNGTGTDSDGTIVSYAWVQTSGPVVSLTNANQTNASFTAPDVASNTALVFELTVTDDDGAQNTDSVTVTVQPVAPPNQEPTADAGANQSVNEGTTVTLAGSGADPDGTIVSYAWSQVSGPAVTIISPNTASASFAAPSVSVATNLVFRLTVTDNDGATASDDVTVTVQDVPPANVPPTASAGADQTVDEGDTVTLTGTGFDSDGTVTGYQWAQVSGPAVSITNANQANASFTAPNVASATNLVFELTVTDDDGATDTDQVTITVNYVEPPNQMPTVNAGADQAVDEGDIVTLTGTASDSDGTIVGYAWVQLSGPNVVISNANQAVASFTAPNVNSSTPLVFRLTATDDDEATASDTVTVTVNNTDPVQTSTALLAINGIPNGNYLAVLVDIQGGSLGYAGSANFVGGKSSLVVNVPPGTALHYLVMDATIPPQYCSGGYVVTI